MVATVVHNIHDRNHSPELLELSTESNAEILLFNLS